MAQKTVKRAKLFKNGGSQAVRLPREFQFQGTEVRVRWEGRNVVLEPVGSQVTAKDVDRARKAIESLGPVSPEFSAVVGEAMKKLQR